MARGQTTLSRKMLAAVAPLFRDVVREPERGVEPPTKKEPRFLTGLSFRGNALPTTTGRKRVAAIAAYASLANENLTPTSSEGSSVTREEARAGESFTLA